MSDGIKATLKSVVGELSGLFDRIDEGGVEKLIGAIQSCNSLFVAGVGRSGLLLRCFTMRMMHMGKPVYFVGDVTTPSIAQGDMLLIGSGSGETGSLVAMAKKAKSLGVKVALISANPTSTIAGMADLTVVVPGPTPKGVGSFEAAPSRQPMGNLLEQGVFLLLDVVVMKLMEKLGKTSDEMFRRHANLE